MNYKADESVNVYICDIDTYSGCMNNAKYSTNGDINFVEID